ncbi:MAG: hypothetical protein ACYTHJ_22625, partial [Planctomycetota bacterium]
LATMQAPGGETYSYAFNEQGNIEWVHYPDETPGEESDNPVRIYHYEDERFDFALTGITDETGARYSTYAYDDEGRATLTEHAGGAGRVILTFNPDGTTTTQDANGAVRTYHFEVVLGVYRVTRIDGGPCEGCGDELAASTNDAEGYPTRTVDRNGVVTETVYDERGLLVSRTQAVGTENERTTTTEWHEDFRLPVRVTRPGQRVETTYDEQGLRKSVTLIDTASGARRTTAFTYTAAGLLASIDGPRTEVADVLHLAYDEAGNLSQVTNALDHQSHVTFDSHGRPVHVEDPNGLTTERHYDARGRLLRETVGGDERSFSYLPTGEVSSVRRGDGSGVDTLYDAARRAIAIHDTDGNAVHYRLNAAGQRVEEWVVNPAGHRVREMERVFDELGRLIEMQGGAGDTMTYSYDANGNRIGQIDGNARATVNVYDALNRMSLSIAPDGGETHIGYDARDNAIRVTDPNGLSTLSDFNGFNQVVRLVSPDTGITRIRYDDAGNRVQSTDARGIDVRTTYDALNRPVFVDYPGTAQDITHIYDDAEFGAGRLTHTHDAGGSTRYTYDINGNVTSVVRMVNGSEFVTAYQYDAQNRVVGMQYPSGVLVDYERDGLGRIDAVYATVDGVRQPIASGIEYEAFGGRTNIRYGNSLAEERSYDASGRLQSLALEGGHHRNYAYDPASNITDIYDLF